MHLKVNKYRRVIHEDRHGNIVLGSKEIPGTKKSCNPGMTEIYVDHE